MAVSDRGGSDRSAMAISNAVSVADWHRGGDSDGGGNRSFGNDRGSDLLGHIGTRVSNRDRGNSLSNYGGSNSVTIGGGSDGSATASVTETIASEDGGLRPGNNQSENGSL